jgi:protein SPT2
MLCLQQQLEDEYCDQDDDDLGDFIVYSDDEDDELSKHKHQRQEELEDGMKEEVEEEVEPVEEVDEAEEEVEMEEAPVGQQEILSLREQLKEKIRRKNAAMTAGTCKARCSSSVNQTILPPGKDG